MKSEYSHLWNDLPAEERERLIPHMMESHILHIEQCKIKAVSAHKAHIKSLNDHIKSIKQDLSMLKPF
jgi:hypothetical protein